MKRFCCFVLFLGFMVSPVCVPAFAAKIDDSPTAVVISDTVSRETLLEKSIQAFPEYEAQLRGENLNETILVQPYSMNSNEIVVSKTRAISATEVVHYTEYANGIALTSLMTTAGKNIYNTGSAGQATVCDLNAWLTCGGSSDVLMINGIKCRYDINLNNSILNVGYIAATNSASSVMQAGFKASGTGGAPAYVDYSGYFTVTISTGGEPLIYEQPGLLRVLGTASVEAY